MPITEIKQPEEEPEVLELGEEEAAAAAAAAAEEGKEPVDEIEYPETLDDEPPADETPLMKHLREKAKQDAREKADLRRQLDEARNRKPVVRQPKPTLESCEWDEDKLADQLLAWKQNEQAADEAERAPPPPPNPNAQRTEQRLATYRAEVVKLNKPDFKASEDAVVAALSNEQQLVIIKAAKHSARFVDALGRSPARLAQLAEITDLIELAAEVARIEGARIMPRKEPANIDTPLRGNGRLSSAPKDEAEAKLLAAAEKDPSKFAAYREHMRAKRAQAA